VTVDEARRLVVAITEAWVRDDESDVVWAGSHEGRWGIRLTQQCRDFTTIWFTVGERTVGYEAFLLPDPPHNKAEAYRLCLSRNLRSWPVSITLDRQGDLAVSGRIPLDGLTPAAVDQAVGAVYETIELSFRPLLAIGFSGREKSR
jgi:hypothetical protein